MALIKCPECGKQMSDMAGSCPHCGYTKKVNQNNSKKSKPNNSKGKFNIKYLIIIVVLLVGGYMLYSKPSQSGDIQPNVNGNYEFNQNGKYFEFPSNYKAYIDADGTIYVGQYIDDSGALIPYISIEKYTSYTNPVDILNELYELLVKEYPDTSIVIDLVNGQINDKDVYGVCFGYTSNGHYVIDNRYAFLIGNSMYLITTKEENQNTDEINNVTTLIIESLKETN